MHELSLMDGVVKALLKSAGENDISKITKVKLVVGKMTAALPSALEFAFEVLSKGTLIEGAELEIEEQEIIGRCEACGKEFKTNLYAFVCPHCGHPKVDIVSGRDLYIDFYEGD